MSHFLNSSLGIKLRGIARAMGVTRMVAPLLQRRDYEEAFSSKLLSEIRAGDCVWDVGANVGYYTTRFAKAAAPGTIVAFEPSPKTFQELVKNTSHGEGVKPMNVALGAATATMGFVTTSDPFGVTHRIASPGENPDLKVQVMTGDQFLAENPALAPNVIKIDVEGYEDDVLAGSRGLLAAKSLRAVFVEVHFRELSARGRENAPNEVVASLENAGFRTHWLDLSHVWGSRY